MVCEYITKREICSGRITAEDNQKRISLGSNINFIIHVSTAGLIISGMSVFLIMACHLNIIESCKCYNVIAMKVSLSDGY